jgi:hypothetical protein
VFSSFLQSPTVVKVLQKMQRKSGDSGILARKSIFDYALQIDPERSSMRSGIDAGSISEIVPSRKKFRVLASSTVA